ncbi:MAG: geranylgeranyl reductase, partial [Gammaproteobacteria bacterium]|nr:geranylgeranyl reductase [Gammaproteobacteria bacterium]
PRDKLCGGLLTLRSAKIYDQIFPQSWDRIIQHRSKGLRIYHKNTLLNHIDNYKTFAFTNRSEYDAFLLEQAITAGAKPYLGNSVNDIDLENNAVTLSDGVTLKANCIIGADGVNSKLAHTLFGSAFTRDRTAFGLEIEVPRSETTKVFNKPEISFGHINWGYAWIFPKKESYTVGIGGLYGKNTDYKKLLIDYSQQRFSHALNYKIKGHFIPFGEYKKIPGKKSVLLCGDAAGLVEPITGEGIAFAMQSGHYAALACALALKEKHPDRAYQHYLPHFKEVSRDIQNANRLKHFIFHKNLNRLFLSLLPRHQGAMKLHVDLMSSDITYAKYAFQLIKKTSMALISRPFH